MIYWDIKMLGRYSCRKIWGEKPVLWLIKKRLQTLQWVQEGDGFKILNFVFMCVISRTDGTEERKHDTEKQMETNDKLIHRRKEN